jgi:hypothetical protein
MKPNIHVALIIIVASKGNKIIKQQNNGTIKN